MPSLMDKDPITWSRDAGGSIDDLGHPIPGVATGFPKTILGNWQDQARRIGASRGGEPPPVRADAVFLSESWALGIVGDKVTDPSGRVFRVIAATPRREIFSSRVEFTRYELARVELPVQQTAGV